jgi:hypothetical protein
MINRLFILRRFSYPINMEILHKEIVNKLKTSLIPNRTEQKRIHKLSFTIIFNIYISLIVVSNLTISSG